MTYARIIGKLDMTPALVKLNCPLQMPAPTSLKKKKKIKVNTPWNKQNIKVLTLSILKFVL